MGTIVKPNLPSSVVRWIGQRIQTVTPSFSEVVAVPIVHDWGPLGSAVGATLYSSFPEWEQDFGSGDTPGRDAVLGAFNGTGDSGAGGVYVYRMATGSAAKASVTRQNTTPANALTLTAKYEGVRGNSISIAIEDDPVTTNYDRLRIMFNGATVESYVYPQADIANLVAQINARSVWVTATQLITGVVLAQTTGVSLAGGNDGSTLDSAAWLAAQNALEYKSFGLFAPFNLTDPTLTAQLVQWTKDAADKMRPFRAFFGGASGEALSAALTAVGTIRDPHIVRLACGTYFDDLLGKNVSTSQLAPRLAGVAAARGRRAALTNARFRGLSLVSGGLSEQERITARDNGLTVFTQVADAENELAISQGVSTYIDKSSVAVPYELFSEPRIVGLLDYVVRRMVKYGQDSVIGNVPVSEDTRLDVAKEVGKILRELVDEQLAEPGSDYVNVPVPSDPNMADAIPYEFGLQPTRTANYLIGEGRVK